MRTLTATSLMSLSASVLLGIVGAATMYVGGHAMLSHTLTPGGYLQYNVLLVFLIAPIMQVVSIGTQLTEALAGLERTQEIMREQPEDQDPKRVTSLQDIVGTVDFEDVSFSYDGTHEVLHNISFRSQPGTVTALVGSSGSGKSTTIGLISAFYVPTAGTIRVDGVDLSTVRLDSYRTRLGVVLQESFLFDGTYLAGLPHRAGRRVCRNVRGQIRHSGRRARRETIGRAAAANFDCARDSGRAANPDSR
jgi:subfamily B ATP-binding cassette protein MsbA